MEQFKDLALILPALLIVCGWLGVVWIGLNIIYMIIDLVRGRK